LVVLLTMGQFWKKNPTVFINIFFTIYIY